MADNREISTDVQRSEGMVVHGLRWIKRGPLLASVDLHIPKIGFTFLQCTWGRSEGRDWVMPPRQRWVGSDGKAHYNDLILMRRSTKERFQEAALEAIKAYCDNLKEADL